jgi:hypothetical protein
MIFLALHAYDAWHGERGFIPFLYFWGISMQCMDLDSFGWSWLDIPSFYFKSCMLPDNGGGFIISINVYMHVDSKDVYWLLCFALL